MRRASPADLASFITRAFVAAGLPTGDAEDVAARMVEPLSNWARFEPGRAERMRQALTRVLQHPGLSKNVAEIASRAMGR